MRVQTCTRIYEGDMRDRRVRACTSVYERIQTCTMNFSETCQDLGLGLTFLWFSPFLSHFTSNRSKGSFKIIRYVIYIHGETEKSYLEDDRFIWRYPSL